MNLLRAGAVLGFLAVGLGAFGTHALRDRLSEEMLKVWQTGTQYQLAHAVMACLCAYASLATNNKKIATAGWLFVGGVVIFSGSLYVLATTDIKILGAITPLGGLAMLAGWLLLAASASDLMPVKD